MTLEELVKNLRENKFAVNETEDYYIIKRKSGLYGNLALIKKDGTNSVLFATPYRDILRETFEKYVNNKK